TLGVAGSLVMLYYVEGVVLYWWPLLFAVSVAGCFIGTYTAPSTDTAVLKKFYATVRPWGFWKPVHAMVVQDDPTFKANKNFKRDMFNVALGIIAQCCLTLLPMYVVLG